MKGERLIVESTEIGEAATDHAGSDRGPLFPRNRLGAPARSRGKWLVPVVMGCGFLALVFATAGKSPSIAKTVVKDKDAAVAAQQAARAVVTDPLGNKVIPDVPESSPTPDGQVREEGQVVPDIREGQNDQHVRSSDDARRNRVVQLRDTMRRSPVMVATVSRREQVPNETPRLMSVPRQVDDNPLDRQLVTNSRETGRAALLGNRNFILTAGAQMPCTLQTAIDSTVPGLVTCLLPRAVLSDNGNVVLLDRGTKVLGEFRGGLQQGQNRIFILWTRAITPAGVSVDLASPAADALGRAGISGNVETFFWKRFGGALLLSVIDQAGSAAGNLVSNADQVSRAPSQAASVALQNELAIAPRLNAPQGSRVSIMVARDLDFSGVYSLRLRR